MTLTRSYLTDIEIEPSLRIMLLIESSDYWIGRDWN
jgi:hypothetical protein